MAGWSMIADDECGLDCSKTPQKKLRPKGFLDSLDPFSQVSGLETDLDANFRCRFDKCLKNFWKEICALDSAFPPMLGDGQSVDLFKLFFLVRKKGGYDFVSRNGLWDLVAKESGFGLNLASSVKLVYVKYLDALEKWLERLIDNKDTDSRSSDSGPNAGRALVELGSEIRGLMSEISEHNLSSEVDSNGDDKCIVDDEESVHIDTEKSVVDFLEVEKLNYNVSQRSLIDSFSDGDKKCKDVQENILSNLTSGNVCDEDEMKSVVVETEGSKKCDNGDENDNMVLDSDAIEESISCRKRKREPVFRVLKWITGIARNPCDPVVASLPEMSKWDSYGNEELWKQVLLIREALFLKRHVDSGTEHSIGQKNRKMHPCLYDDQVGSAYNFRERLKSSKKLLCGKTESEVQTCLQISSSTIEYDLGSCTKGTCNNDYSTKYSVLDIPVEKPIPLGPDFQAEVPEWTGLGSESDSKWVGTRVWPPEKIDRRLVIEREPIGKGRQDSCGCEVSKSMECVRFHCAEKRLRLKRELGTTTFHHWRFDKMGEGVKLSWTKDEEKKFKDTVQLNPPSLYKYFWDEMFKCLPAKRREDLVSYYFNVFLPQCRAHQNRFTPNNIDSDDESCKEAS